MATHWSPPVCSLTSQRTIRPITVKQTRASKFELARLNQRGLKMARRVRMFYGFPSQPPTVGETIDHAIQELKTHHEITTNRVRFYPWPAIRSSGANLAQTVINRIDSSQIFACDLTYPNHNVSFELGYAIGRFKRLFVSIDTSIESSTRHFRRNYFNLLGLGYSTYENHKQLARALLDEKPWRDMSISVLNQRYRQPFGRPEMPQLMFNNCRTS